MLIVPATRPLRNRLSRKPANPPKIPPTDPRRRISEKKAPTISRRLAPMLRRMPASFIRLTTVNMAVLYTRNTPTKRARSERAWRFKRKARSISRMVACRCRPDWMRNPDFHRERKSASSLTIRSTRSISPESPKSRWAWLMSIRIMGSPEAFGNVPMILRLPRDVSKELTGVQPRLRG